MKQARGTFEYLPDLLRRVSGSTSDLADYIAPPTECKISRAHIISQL
jgi:hypothetical protein